MATSVTEGALANGVQQANILWGAGADVGVYRVYPTAANNFWIDRQVNVVKITYTLAEGADNRLEIRNDQYAPMLNPGSPGRFDHTKWLSILSAGPDPNAPTQVGNPTMQAKLVVQRIEGPKVGMETGMRGVKFMEIGLIQNSKHRENYAVIRQSAAQNGVDLPADVNYRYILEGNTYLDSKIATVPWYYPIHEDGQVAVWSPTTDPSNALTSLELKIDDRPNLKVTDALYPLYNGSRYRPSRLVLISDFLLYFAVRTKETALAADLIYTQRGKVEWYFNGTGVITYAAAQNGWSWSWAKDGAENGAVGGNKYFQDVTTGAVVPVTTGPTANEADQAAQSSTSPPPYSVR
jgi:hypothetical protein